MLTWAEIRTLLYERHDQSWSKAARTLGLSDQAVLAYRDGKAIPGFQLVDAIATAIDRPRTEVHEALVAARVERDTQRKRRIFATPVKPLQEVTLARPTPAGRRPASPLRLPGRRAKRKLAAWLLAGASVGALGQPLRVEASRLITDHVQVRQFRRILSTRRLRWAA